MYSFGYNPFWNFAGSAAVQELLTKSDLQLSELLEEDGLTLELKTHNKNLYNFLLREENFKELISCAVSIPDEEAHQDNPKKLYKYPFTCSDILSSDSQQIISEFFKNAKEIEEQLEENTEKEKEGEDDEVNVDDSEEKTKATTEEEKDHSEKEYIYPYLDVLFGILEKDTLNYTSAGYFAKIVNNLLNKKQAELLFYLYENRPDLLNHMMRHIYSKSIAEFLAKLITFEKSAIESESASNYGQKKLPWESSEESEETKSDVDRRRKNKLSETEVGNLYTEKRIEILKKVVKKLEPENDIEEINNTAYLACEVLSKYNSMHDSQKIITSLLEDSEDHFFYILKSGKSTSVCATALILGNIFAYYILIQPQKLEKESQKDPEESNISEPEKPFSLDETQIPILKDYIENLDAIVKIIGSSSEEQETITGQHGTETAPFGSARLKVLELILISMKANNKKVYSKLIETGFFPTLQKVMVRHTWNNLLHNQVEKIFTHVIEGGQEFEDLKIDLYEKAKILEFIVEGFGDSEISLPGKHARKIRKGYLGHLVRLSNKIVEFRDPITQKYTDENQQWKTFIETELKETNQRERTNFGGRDPRAPSPERSQPLFGREELEYTLRSHDEDEKKEEDLDYDDEINDEDEDEELEREKEGEGSPRETQKVLEEVLENGSGAKKSPIKTSDEFVKDSLNCVGTKNPHLNDEEENRAEDPITTIPVRGRNSFDPLSKFIPDYDEAIKEENENLWVMEPANLMTSEESLDSKYYPNNYWKKTEICSVDDVLKEIMEGL